MFFNQQTSLQHTEEKNQHKPEIKQRLGITNFFEKHVPGTCIQSEICPTKYTYYNHTFDWSNLLRNKIMMVSIVRVSFLKPLIPVTRHNQRNPRRPTLCKSPRVCAPGVEEVTMTSYQTSWFHLPSPNRQTAELAPGWMLLLREKKILRLPWIAKSVSMQSHSHARALDRDACLGRLQQRHRGLHTWPAHHDHRNLSKKPMKDQNAKTFLMV